MYKVEKMIKGYKPLCYVDNRLLLSSGYDLYLSKNDLSDVTYLTSIPTTTKQKVYSKFRFLSRIFRVGINFSLNLGDGTVLILCRSDVWILNYKTGVIKLDFTIPNSRTALYMTLLNDSLGKRVAFGEYFKNLDKKPVNIWVKNLGSNNESDWSVIYTFDAGQINHVHNIVQTTSDIYVLTGDFDNSAAIYKMLNNNLIKIVGGNQSYRSCWLTEKNNKLIYATDSQFEANNVNVLDIDGLNMTTISPIEGSSIYYSETENGLFFSSTVEPGELSGNYVKDVLSYDRGEGILSDRAFIYLLGRDLKVSEILVGDKDFYPSRLGQFGTFTFPSGIRDDDDLICFGVGLKKFDNQCIYITKNI
jgi:hypothetical protein